MPINKQVYDLVGLLSPYFARTGGAGTGGGAGLDWAPATTTAGVDKDGAEDNGGAGWTRMAGHTYLWAPLKITEILWDISVAGTYAMYISSGPSAVVQKTVVAAQVVAAPGTEVSFVPDAGVLCLDAGEYWLTVEISAGTCAWDVFHGDAENVLYYAFDSYMDAVVKPDWVAPFKLVAHIGTWLGTVAPGTTLAHGDLTGVTPAQHHAPVTLGGGSDPALALAGQELTLADVLTPAEHTAIGDGAPHHAAVTLGADAGAVLGLTGQQIDLDVQNANTVLAGPAAAPAADPTFRALVPADVGTGVPTGALFLRDDMSWQAPGGALGDHDHSGDAGDGGTFDAANLTAGASTDGQVLTSDGAGGGAWEDPTGGPPDAHDIVGASHTLAGAALSVVGATALNTIGLLTPSANPGAASALLKSDADGYLRLTRLGIGMAPTNPLDVTGNAGITGGLNLGTATGATAGQIKGSGALVMSGAGDSSFVGKVGIGTASPTDKLHLFSNSANVKPYVDAPAANEASWQFASAGTSKVAFGRLPTSENAFIWVAGGGVALTVTQATGAVWMVGDCSALSFTDRPGSFLDIETATAAILSMKQSADGKEVDHTHLHPYIQAAGGGRNLSATMNAQNLVIQHLLSRIAKLEGKTA